MRARLRCLAHPAEDTLDVAGQVANRHVDLRQRDTQAPHAVRRRSASIRVHARIHGAHPRCCCPRHPRESLRGRPPWIVARAWPSDPAQTPLPRGLILAYTASLAACCCLLNHTIAAGKVSYGLVGIAISKPLSLGAQSSTAGLLVLSGRENLVPEYHPSPTS
jgi:hypothetical protein